MKGGVLTRLKAGSLEVVSPVALVLLWEIIARAQLVDTRFWPAPTTILEQLWHALSQGGLGNDIWVTTTRLGVGILIGGFSGLIIGLGMGLWRSMRVTFRPLLAMTYPIPKIAVLPLFLLLFGLGEASKWAIVSVGVFYLVAINTFAGVRNIEAVHQETATIYRISWWRRVRTVFIPGALPLILTGFELGIGVGFLLVVAAEFVSARSGVGYSIWLAWQTFNIPLMYAGLAVVAVYGFLIQAGSRWLEQRLVPWRRTGD